MDWNYKFNARLHEGFTRKDLLFLKQLGVSNAFLSLPKQQHDLTHLKRIKKRIEAEGIAFTNIQSNLYTFNADIALGTENRDLAIDGYIEFIETVAKVGINHIEQNMAPYFVYSSNIESETRGATTRAFDLDVILNSETAPLARSAYVKKGEKDKAKELERLFQESKKRGYTKEELWDNFSYFMKRVLPVAEKCGVRLSLHPNDPPCEEPIGGVPQLISCFDDYLKAFEIADSDALSMTFCCGCWLEGGERFGNILENLEWGLRHKKIEMIHMRNITGPMPRFNETFLDNGYFDMYKIFRLLRKYDYRGFINPDHHPVLVDGVKRRAPQAYAFGFMRAYALRADAEYRQDHSNGI